MAEASVDRGPVSLKTKLAFSSGSLEEAMIGAAGIATMIFYNQVLGVSPALCGIAFAIGSIIDAVSDPIVAAWSDNFRSRWGRRHPFMAFSALPLTLGFYLMYAPPSNLTETQYFFWLIFTVILIRVGKTFYSVPHAALGAELTDDYHDRTKIFGFNTLVGAIGGLLLSGVMLFALFPSTDGFVNGFTNPHGYPILALSGGLWIILTTFLCVYGTRDQIPRLHDVQQQRVSVFDNWKDLKSLLQSKSYLSVCVAWLVMTVSGGILGVVGTYTFLYGYEMSTEELIYIRLAYIPGMLLCLPAAAWLTSIFDKKWTVILTCIFCATMVGLPHTLQLYGFFPPNNSVWMLPTFIGMMTIGLSMILVVPVVIDSQLVDVADEHELKTGRRSEGMVFAFRTFAIKATSSVGNLIGGFGLEIINFPDNATVETITQETLNGLFFMMGPLYWMICFAGMLFMGMYQLNKTKHAEIIHELRTRRASSHRDETITRNSAEPIPVNLGFSNEAGPSDSSGNQEYT